MKKLTLLFSLLIFFGCSNDDSKDSEPNLEFGTKEITVTIQLPENTSINPSDLTISTIFTENETVENETGSVEIFDNDAFELIYATNSSGNIVLMSYINPINGNEITLDSKSTAKTLAMFHPWTMHLSVQAKEEAFAQIEQLSEFNAYHNEVITNINSGSIDPLATEQILESLDDFQTSIFSRVEQEILPLKMIAENNTIDLTNRKSSLDYEIELFGKNGQQIGESVVIGGINKRLLSWSNVLNVIDGSFDFFQPTNLNIAIPNENQEYLLKADAWSGFAAVNNSFELASNFIGIFSTSVATIFENAACAVQIGNLFVSKATTVSQLITGGEMSNGQALKELILFLISVKDEIYGVTSSCSEYLLPQSAFGKLIEKLSIIGNLENGAVLIFNIADISLYQNQLEFCFKRTETEIVECENEIVGTWQFVYDCSGGQYPPLGPYDVTFFDDFTMNIENVGSINGCTDNGTYSFDGTNLSFTYDTQCDETSPSGMQNDSWNFTGSINSDNDFTGDVIISVQVGSEPPVVTNCTAAISN
ncbi:hypothetical protein [Algibacter sp. PT7-4]|uniref:hypothetical protein n=1 Tax=Algibacter ulvanivorans TaxID=3400999 RepID=UPI003AAC247C